VKLGDLLRGIQFQQKIQWDPHRSIRKISSDSRTIDPGDFFVACKGAQMDGHDFLGQAIFAKAAAVAFEQMPEFKIPRGVNAVLVPDTCAFLAEILKRYHGYPDRKVKTIGVTGTNGKTTTSYLLHRLLREKTRTAYVGTLWYEWAQEKLAALNTTPSAEILFPLLGQMHRDGVSHCVMEVSSHALEQRRVHGLQFEVAIFMQLTQDHLDYHGDMESYFQAKRRLFTGKHKPRHMLVNKDCFYGKRLLLECPDAKSFGRHEDADYRIVNIDPSLQGSRFTFAYRGKEIPFQLRLPMRYNVINAAAVLSALDLLGYDPEDFRGFLQEIPGIPGRMERIGAQHDFSVFVDYAHTPDAFVNVLSEVRKLKQGRVLTLFGAGGDRDQGKRPLMAQAACRFSDVVVVTSDNPRSEDPEEILNDIKEGIPEDYGENHQVIEVLDRREAIQQIISMAEPGDVVMILGKGHENYQILGERKIPFDDRLIIQECLQKKSGVFFS